MCPYGFKKCCCDGEQAYIVDFGHGNGRPLQLLVRGLSLAGVGFEITEETFKYSQNLLQFYQENISDQPRDMRLENFIKLYEGDFKKESPLILGERNKNLVIAYSFSRGMCPDDLNAMCGIFNKSFGIQFIIIDRSWNELINHGTDHLCLTESFKIEKCQFLGLGSRMIYIHHVKHIFKMNLNLENSMLVKKLDNSEEKNLFPNPVGNEFFEYFDKCFREVEINDMEVNILDGKNDDTSDVNDFSDIIPENVNDENSGMITFSNSSTCI